ncbi:MAG: hypothetical protein HC869_13015 [Rhodospirillales bacterium]|nr:hypothetical protein [Rhodospirillales bacterium]
MKLLDEVVQGSIDSKTPVSVLLRRCLVLAARLGNENLKTWANQELSGYSNAETVPDYRLIRVHAKGNFSGPFGSELKNWPIPSAALEKEHRHWAEKAMLVQPVAAFDDLLAGTDNDSSGSFLMPWPSNLTLYYQSKLIDDQALISAWQVVPRGVIAGLVDTIRNRILNLALEIQSELKGSDDLDALSRTDVERTVINNIFGGHNVFASHGNAVANLDRSQTNITIEGDRRKLDEILHQAGLASPDLKALTDALEADGNKLDGSRVVKWIKDVAPKLAISGVKYGAGG